MSFKPNDPQYLGDGVYATLNDFGQLVLTTGSHNEETADNIIYMEPEVLSALLRLLGCTYGHAPAAALGGEDFRAVER